MVMVQKYNKTVLFLKTLFYNSHFSVTYNEILLRPLVRISDFVSIWLGPVLVVGVVILTGIIIAIVYIYGLPYYWSNYPNLTTILFIYGHWILINIVFNYYMGFKTKPGAPPEGLLFSEGVSICKVCITPKPARTHHCSVCNRCILKMDHHCPWLNNCVGYFNHRYFYMYMVYMVIGASFVLVFGFEMFYVEMWIGDSEIEGYMFIFLNYFTAEDNLSDSELTEKDIEWGEAGHYNGSHFISEYNEVILVDSHSNEIQISTERIRYRFVVVFTSLLTSGAFLGLLFLVLMHGRLISRGETSIENLINKKERKRFKKMSQIYKNPYDFGVKENWRLFLGLSEKRNILSILFPSTHLPDGDGLKWKTSHDKHNKIV